MQRSRKERTALKGPECCAGLCEKLEVEFRGLNSSSSERNESMAGRISAVKLFVGLARGIGCGYDFYHRNSKLRKCKTDFLNMKLRRTQQSGAMNIESSISLIRCTFLSINLFADTFFFLKKI